MEDINKIIQINQERNRKIDELCQKTGECRSLCKGVIYSFERDTAVLARLLGATEVGAVKSIVSDEMTHGMSELERIIYFSTDAPLTSCCKECKKLRGTMCTGYNYPIENSKIREMHTACKRFIPKVKPKPVRPKKQEETPGQMVLSFQ